MMSEIESAPETTSETERKGRGPTRPVVKFADLVEDVARLDEVARSEFRVTIESSPVATAKELRDIVKQRRKALKDYISDEETSLGHLETRAALLARVEELPPALRVALPAAIRAGEE